MHRIDDHSDYLFDPWRHFGPKRKTFIKKSWAGVFRKFLLNHLPIELILQYFHKYIGRPSKEIYSMVGALILQQMFDLTDEETLEAYCFNEMWHYALDIRDTSDKSMYLANRTLRTYRNFAVQSGLADILFHSLTDKLIQDFKVKTDKQRLDSTHLLSNMKRLNRLNLFVATIGKFLKELKRLLPDRFKSQLDQEQVDPYLKEKGGCFSKVRGDEAKRKLEEVSQDLYMFVKTFETDEQVKALESYHLLRRLLEEQCEVIEENQEEKVQLKPAKEIDCTSMQNPSDPDATYDGHKGTGYQAQIMETYSTDEDEKQLDLITYVEVEAAHERDENTPPQAIEATQERNCAPKILTADAAYGSDENVEKALDEGVEIIAPTKGEPKSKEEKLILEDFTLDEETGIIQSCPNGEEPIEIDDSKEGILKIYFDPAKCETCDHRDYCSGGLDKDNKIQYTPKQARLAQRRVHEESEVFRDTYRWRAGIEATNAKLKQVMGMGRLRVRGLGRVRHAVMLKALGWNIFQVVRAIKACFFVSMELIFIMNPVATVWTICMYTVSYGTRPTYSKAYHKKAFFP